MRICIVSLFYKPAGGGIPRYVENLAKSLGRLGNDIDIITASYGEKEIIEEESDRINIYALPCLNIFGKSEEECMEKSREFLKFLKKYTSTKRVDIIVAQNLHAAISSVSHSFVLNMVAIERKIPVILTIHSFPEDPDSQLKISLAKNLFWDKIVAVSSSIAETFNNKGIEVDRIRVICPGIDTKVFRANLGKKWLRSRIEGLKESDIVILHASRTDSVENVGEKGIKTLLKAFTFCCEKRRDVKLLIASAPVAPPFEEGKKKAIILINDFAKLYNISDKVKIVTFNPEEMPLVYNGCDIFVMASKIESFGLVYAEAMACGLPVIGTAVGGIPEVIENGVCGYLAPPDNPVELSKYLGMLLNDAKKRKKFGNNGRKIVLSKFDADKIAVKRIGNYKSLLYKKNKKRKFSFLREIVDE